MVCKVTEESEIIISDQIRIPLSELRFRFSTSSGPGGQHANRSATRVTLLFDVASSPSLDDETRARLLKKLAHRLDKQGILRIQVQDTRSQKQNRAIAESRFMAELAEAADQEQKTDQEQDAQVRYRETSGRKEKGRPSQTRAWGGLVWTNPKKLYKTTPSGSLPASTMACRTLTRVSKTRPTAKKMIRETIANLCEPVI